MLMVPDSANSRVSRGRNGPLSNGGGGSGGWESVDFSDLMDHQYDPRSSGNTTSINGSDVLFDSFDDLIGSTDLTSLSTALPADTTNRPIHTLDGNAVEENGQQAMGSIDRDGAFDMSALASATRTIAFLMRGNGLANAPYSLSAINTIHPIGNAGTGVRIPDARAEDSDTDLILPSGAILYINGVAEHPANTTYSTRAELFTGIDDEWVSVIATNTTAFHASELWYGASRHHDGRHIMGSMLTAGSVRTPSEVTTIHNRLTSTAFEWT